jgi:dTDP-4-dehydrorhamnose 3,5-epimerase
MLFRDTSLAGAFVLEMDLKKDERGFFARTFCEDEFRAHGLVTRSVQCNVSFNAKRGTLRGMHYQIKPHEEAKLIRVTKGAIQDVIVDIRPDSPTYLKWIAVELNEENRRMLYVPAGFAHGFQTLADNTEVFYQMFAFFHADCARGLRWDDPALKIDWPAIDQRIISKKDLDYPLLEARA